MKTGTHHKTQLPLNDMSQAAFIIAALEATGQLGWKLIYLSQYGIIAHTNPTSNEKVQEVIIRAENSHMLVRSDNTTRDLFGRKKNEQNVTDFLETFNRVKEHVTEEYALELLQTQPLHFAHPYHDILSPERFSKIGKRDNPLKIFWPREGYFVTPLLLISNILVFIFMAIMGVDLLEPGGKIIYEWGGNFGPAILRGQWWRLISAAFVHIGIVHLMSNMLALGFIGFALEPVLGKERFLTAYLLTGVTGGLLSMYVHPQIVSAGASGAIFGLYGVFIAMLATRPDGRQTHGTALFSMALYVLYNLAMGMKEGVDNAGHIGGLIGGILIGVAMYPSLKNKTSAHTKYNTLAILVIGVAALAAWTMSAMR